MRVSGVGKAYRRGHWVLSEVTMHVPAGASVAVVGANGSGKSTLLKVLAGVSRPTTGRIVGRPAVVGYVPDRFPAADAMGALAYLVHIGRIRGLDTASARRRGSALLGRLELVGGLRTPVRALSKGNAQKVALAQALMVPPRLLVLDEPWSGLDAGAHGVLGEMLQEVLGDGGAVVFTDHREAVGRAPATLAYTVHDGRVTQAGPGARPGPIPVAHVVVTRASGPRRAPGRVDWSGLRGVVEVAATADAVHVRVHPDACDEILTIALRNGWSVAEVHRGGPPRRDGEAGAWAH